MKSRREERKERKKTETKSKSGLKSIWNFHATLTILEIRLYYNTLTKYTYITIKLKSSNLVIFGIKKKPTTNSWISNFF